MAALLLATCLTRSPTVIRLHPSAYVSIRQHTSHTQKAAYVSIRMLYVCFVSDSPAYVSIRQHTSHEHTRHMLFKSTVILALCSSRVLSFICDTYETHALQRVLSFSPCGISSGGSSSCCCSCCCRGGGGSSSETHPVVACRAKAR